MTWGKPLPFRARMGVGLVRAEAEAERGGAGHPSLARSPTCRASGLCHDSDTRCSTSANDASSRVQRTVLPAISTAGWSTIPSRVSSTSNGVNRRASHRSQSTMRRSAVTATLLRHSARRKQMASFVNGGSKAVTAKVKCLFSDNNCFRPLLHEE